MKVSVLYFLVIAFSTSGFCATITADPSEEPALLIISYDAFRPEYLNRNVTPNLNKFQKEGVTAPFMLNVFPTKTFVNHHTIATGLYPEVHGVTGNEIFDLKLGRLGYSYELFHYDESVVPILIANEMAGKHSGSMMWPGGHFSYGNRSVTFGVQFNQSIPWKERVDTVMSWFTHEETPANIVMLYIEDPDSQSHIYGPDSQEVTDIVSKLDDLTKYIQDQLVAHNLDERVNVIHLSDHGMASVSPPNFIDLRKFSTIDSFKWYGSSPVLQIVPNNASITDELYANLTKAAKENGHFKVYNTKNLPKRWHANNKRRIGPILAVADMNYAFHDMIAASEDYEKNYNVPNTNETKYGCHGYDNEEDLMHAIFMARGPLFSTNKLLKPVQMINLYNLFCLILDIKCPKNNGSNKMEIWNDLLKKQSSTSHSGHSNQKKEFPMHVQMIAVLILFILFNIVVVITNRSSRKRNSQMMKCFAVKKGSYDSVDSGGNSFASNTQAKCGRW